MWFLYLLCSELIFAEWFRIFKRGLGVYQHSGLSRLAWQAWDGLRCGKAMDTPKTYPASDYLAYCQTVRRDLRSMQSSQPSYP